MIYGAGTCGRDVLAVLTKHGIPVTCFLDKKYPSGATINGLPVLHPDDGSFPLERRKSTCVIIGIFNKFVDIASLTGELSGYGYNNITDFVRFHAHFSEDFGDRFWLTSPDAYGQAERFLVDCYQLWDDEPSRRLYRSVLKFRLTSEYANLPCPEKGPQYFDPDLPRWKTPVRFIDCGSYDGDTLSDLSKAYDSVDAIAAFEPDLVNFEKLHHKLRSRQLPYGDIAHLFPCAVWSHAARLTFTSSENREAGALSPNGDMPVLCVSIDEALPGFRPTLIKMDVEGAEFHALIGARQTLNKYRPELAICLYHRPEHLWQIPLLVRQLGPNYSLTLRSYGYSGFDLVLYAR